MIDLHNITAQELLSPQSGLVADQSIDLFLTVALCKEEVEAGMAGEYGSYNAWDEEG